MEKDLKKLLRIVSSKWHTFSGPNWFFVPFGVLCKIKWPTVFYIQYYCGLAIESEDFKSYDRNNAMGSAKFSELGNIKDFGLQFLAWSVVAGLGGSGNSVPIK